MKKFTSVLAVLAVLIIFYLTSCGEGTYEDGYKVGYGNGYGEGYYEGIAEAQSSIAFYVEDELIALKRDIEDEYGMHPGEAVEVLTNYADVPDEVTEEDLKKAIWSLYRYYYDSHNVINGIEDYWIE